MSKRMSITIAVLITVLWTISTVLDAVNKNYDPRPEMGPLMVCVAGFAFANATLGNKIRKDDAGGD